MQAALAPIVPLTTDELPRWKHHPSHHFEDYFDPAIVGTTLNTSGRPVLVYDEEKLIDLMVQQLKEAIDDPDEILWEDGAMFISDGLEMALEKLGDEAPVIG